MDIIFVGKTRTWFVEETKKEKYQTYQIIKYATNSKKHGVKKTLPYYADLF